MDKKQQGFTLIEILVVIIITATLSSILILYSRTSEQQIILFRDQAKLIGLLFRAKSLAVTSRVTNVGFFSGIEGVPCAYGFHIEKNDATKKWEFRIFKDLAKIAKDPTGTEILDCEGKISSENKSDNKYGLGEDLDPPEVQTIGENVELISTNFKDVTFKPPEPQIIFDNNPATKIGAIIIGISGGSQKTVKINNFGQITAQ